MKPEPLKGKGYYCRNEEPNPFVYEEEDIRSTIEWLKEELKKYLINIDSVEKAIETSHKLVDKAFEDVKIEKGATITKTKYGCSIKRRTSRKLPSD